ncbi:MAG: LysR family transcriptional regulator [Myxococcota bacterium]
MELPDPDTLRCFEAAATKPTFRAAAERVHLSPAAFSGRIRQLESLLDVTLFERTTRRVVLTAAGRRLLPHVRRALRELARCGEVARDEDARVPFTLVLGTRYELGMSWLVPAIADLRESRPERKLELYFADSPDLLRRVALGRLDAMISSARLVDAGLAYALLHEERYVLVASPDLLEARPLAGPEDAPRHVLLDIHRDLPLFRYFQDARSGQERWAFADSELLGTIGPVRHRVLEGAGVAVLPRYFVQPDLDAGRLREVFPDTEPERDWFRLVWREGHPLDDELRALAGELAERPLK